jgi:hypothetical protein
MGLTLIEVIASVHVALSCLCEPQSVVVGVPIESDRSINANILIDSRIFFQIFVQDLPRSFYHHDLSINIIILLT